jgi:hypothetical protein
MGILTFDAGGPLPPPATGDGGTTEDGGVITLTDGGAPPFDGGPIGTTPDGVLTNRPDYTFVNAGDPNLVIVTAAFQVEETSGGDFSFHWAGEFENRGPNIVCIIFVDATIHGLDVLTVADAPMWALTSSTTTSRYQCVGPGQRGAYNGRETPVSPSFLDGTTTVYYDLSGLVTNDAHPDLALPLVAHAEVVHQVDLAWWTIDNRWRTQSIPIYNFAAEFYVKIGGLLWDDQPGFHLEDVPSFTEFDSNTRVGFSAPFEEWIVFPDFLVRRGLGLVDVHDPWFLRYSESRSRRARLRELRGQ